MFCAQKKEQTTTTDFIEDNVNDLLNLIPSVPTLPTLPNISILETDQSKPLEPKSPESFSVPKSRAHIRSRI